MRLLLLDPLGILHYVWDEGRMMSVAGAVYKGAPVIVREYEVAAVFTILRLALRNQTVPLA